MNKKLKIPAINKYFTILSGRRLLNAYINAVGDKSCMTGKKHAKLVQFYADFPTQIKLLVYQKTKARALLWKPDKGKLIIDKIYTKLDNELVYSKYEEWAKYNKAIIEYNIPNNTSITLEKSAIRLNIPHIDTFNFCDIKNKKLILKLEDYSSLYSYHIDDLSEAIADNLEEILPL